MNDHLNQVKKDGFCLVESAISMDTIEEFKRDFYPLFEEKKAQFRSQFKDGSKYSANHDINRWNMLLPSNSVLLSSGFYASPEIMSVLRGVFDTPFALVFFSSDIASPGSTYQTIHQDGNDFAIALNVPLVDSTAENGSTQVFPGTHRVSDEAAFSTASNEFTDEQMEERAAKLTPLHLDVKCGDLTLRDLRLIHRGTPNHSDVDRPYLSAIYLPSPEDTAPTFETIEAGLAAFAEFKKRAFPTGRVELIDFADTFGRLVMGFSHSDRVQRPIPKHVSDELNEDARYVLRFAKFEDDELNARIRRDEQTSAALAEQIALARKEFDKLYEWDEEHALDQVLNHMIKSLEEDDEES